MLNQTSIVKAFKDLIFALRIAAAWAQYGKLVHSYVTKKMHERISHADFDV